MNSPIKLPKKEGIRYVWSIACSASIIGQNNNVSLMNVIEQFNLDISAAPKGKLIQLGYPFELITLWRREGNIGKKITGDARIRFVDWRGKELMKGDYKLEFPNDKKRIRSISKFPGIKIMDVGNHSFFVDIKQENDKDYVTVGEIPVEIRAK